MSAYAPASSHLSRRQNPRRYRQWPSIRNITETTGAVVDIDDTGKVWASNDGTPVMAIKMIAI
jgi:hypothetical protein